MIYLNRILTVDTTKRGWIINKETDNVFVENELEVKKNSQLFH